MGLWAWLSTAIASPLVKAQQYVFNTKTQKKKQKKQTKNAGRDDGFVEIILANCGCVHRCLVNSTEDTFS